MAVVFVSVSCKVCSDGSQTFSDRIPFAGPVLSARNTLFQEKSTFQILFDQKFGNNFDLNKMAVRIFVAIFKANKEVHKNSGIF